MPMFGPSTTTGDPKSYYVQGKGWYNPATGQYQNSKPQVAAGSTPASVYSNKPIQDIPTGSTTYTSNYTNPFDTMAATTSANDSVGPNYHNMTDFLTNFQSNLTAPDKITTTSLYDQFKDKAPSKVLGLGQDYYTAEKDRRMSDLRNEFFGPMGVLNQAASGEAAAGRLGSGVGSRVLEATVTNPFAQAYTGIQRDVGQQYAQEQARVQELNATRQDEFQKTLATLAQTDSINAIEATAANQKIQYQYDELAAKLADAAAGNLNDWEIAQLEQRIKAAWDADQSKIEWEKLNLQEEEMKLQYV